MPTNFSIPHQFRCLSPIPPMPKKLFSTAAAAALFAFAPALLTPALLAQGDVVVKKDGARLRGLEVTEFALTGVKAKRGDAS